MTALAAAPAHAVANAGRKPNFIIIFADDLGYGDLGSYGSRLIRTPNLDRMAREGLKMTQAYASANLCTPSRAGLMTGRYPIRSGLAWQVIQPGDNRGLKPEEVTIAEALGSDYVSALIGKWHLGHVAPYWPPTNQGFDLFFGLPYSHDMKPLALYAAQRGVELTLEDVDFPRLTQRFFERGYKFIDENRDRPFLLMLSLTAPHLPLNPHPEHQGHSPAAAYGDVIEEVDARVGDLLAKLKNLGLARDSYVIVTSDNGPWLEGSTGGLRDRKGGGGFEGGFRVPFLVWAPGNVPAGRTSTALTMNTDILPSLVSLARVAPPAGLKVDGLDMSGLWRGKAHAEPRDLLLFNNEQIAGIRSGRWKWVARSYYRGVDVPVAALKGDLLFDVEADPSESYNLASLHPEVVKSMRTKYEAANAEFGPLATRPVVDPKPGECLLCDRKTAPKD